MRSGSNSSEFEIEEGAVEITLEASFDGLNLGLVAERLDDDIGLWRTHRTGKRLAMATSSSLRVDGRELAPTASGALKRSWTWTSRPAQFVCFERFVAVVRSDALDRDPARTPGQTRRRAARLGWRGSVAAHEAAWASAGGAATWRSRATRRRSRRCDSPSIT